MDPRPPHPTSQVPTIPAASDRPRRADGRSRGPGLGRGRIRVGPWRARRRFLPLALVPVLVYLALWLLVAYGLGAAGCRGPRPAVPLLAAQPAVGVSGTSGSSAASARPAAAPAPAAAAPIEVLVESNLFARPPSAAGNRFDSGWQVRRLGSGEALVPVSGTGRLLAVNLGEEEPRTLTLAFARDGLPEGELLSVRTGDRELARATLHAGAMSMVEAALRPGVLRLQLRLPEDLPVGQVPLDLVFGQAAGTSPQRAAGTGPQPVAATGPQPAAATGPQPAVATGPQPAAATGPRPAPGTPPAPFHGPGQGGVAGAGEPAAPAGVPAVLGASLAPALRAGGARVDGADVVIGGNCLVYLRCQLAGQEALVGTFVPPEAPQPGQRFELSVERPDGTPIRRFGWRPSFWNRLRGARTFELPLRGARGPVRVRLISRAGDAGGLPGRWHALGLRNVTGEILTPGQGQ